MNNKYQSKIRAYRHLTLIEILVAFSILSAFLVPFSVFYGFQFRERENQDQRLHALNLAREKMNQILEQPFAKLPIGLFSDKLLIDRKSGESLLDLRPHMARKTLFHLQLESQFHPLLWDYETEDHYREKVEVNDQFVQLLLTVSWGDGRRFSLLGFKGNI